MTTTGYSEAAIFSKNQISSNRERLEQSYALGAGRQEVYEALYAMCEECQDSNWDGHGAEPISLEAYRNAYAFVEALPMGCRSPSVGAEPDGHVTFEWYKSTSRVLSASVSPEGMIYYAALLGSGKRSGAEPFRGEIPQPLLEIIRLVGPT